MKSHEIPRSANSCKGQRGPNRCKVQECLAVVNGNLNICEVQEVLTVAKVQEVLTDAKVPRGSKSSKGNRKTFYQAKIQALPIFRLNK